MSSIVWLVLAGHLATPASPDEFAAQSRFHSLDPRVKVVSAVIFAVSVSLMTQLWPLLLAFIVSVVILFVSGLRLIAIRRQMRLIALLLLTIALPVYFFRGLDAFLAMLLRVSAAAIILLAMILTTASADLANGLRRLGLPKSLVALLAMTYRYIFICGDEAARMTRAREARGGGRGGGFFDRRALRGVSSTAGMVLVRAHGRAKRIDRAMRARGYAGEVTFGRENRMSLPDGYVMLALVTVSILLLLINWGVLQWKPL